MAKNKKKDRRMASPVERHDTAAWAEMEDMKPVSKVNLPDEIDILNAKEYVDSNQK
ncbi:MAG TPA: DUF3787 domain-containing protein [Firmicutes bacterium]|nr:DUF3787 domain-containing protein [Bacillota bacterium]